ncbi:MAG: LexA family transcriptional regulator [Betaproteobacteria bacterium]|nr:LexA family transcriptional regulator [Betaproteobacteria bacterium]
MDASQLSQIAGRHPTRNIGTAMARRIEKVFHKAEGWLDVSHSQLPLQQRAERNVHPARDLQREVPLISWVQAGAWDNLVDTFQPGDAERWIATYASVSNHAFALRIIGDSMTNPHGAPSFPEGTVIIVDPERAAQPGKFVVVRQNSDTECTFKQLVRDGGQHYLKPLNPRYPVFEMLPDAVVAGVVVQAVMDL